MRMEDGFEVTEPVIPPVEVIDQDGNTTQVQVDESVEVETPSDIEPEPVANESVDV